MDVSVVVGTYGEMRWRRLAKARAIPSVPEGVPVHHVHGDSLAAARNAALRRVETEWVIHLDADDELEDGYLAAMVAAEADLRAPAVRYVQGKQPLREPIMLRVAGHRHDCAAECLRDGNWIVIGALARTELVREAGSWREFSWSEDWDLWLRCWLIGASIEAVPEAVYRAHVRRDSRNRSASQQEKLRAHREIEAANFG